jgi:hypothetical protein
VRTLLALTFAVALTWGSTAHAKDLHHLVGEMVDARGVLIGRLVGETTVLLRVKGVTFALHVGSDSFAGADNVIAAFTTPDCRGRVYLGRSEPLASIYVKDGFRVYAVRPDAVLERVLIRSTFSLGSCVEFGEALEEDTYHAPLLIDLTGRWVPPFRIR